VFDGPSRYRETYGGSCGQPPARRQSAETTKLMLVGRAGPGRGRRRVVWAPALLWLVENHPRRSRAGASRRGSARCGHAKTEPFGCCGIRGEGAPCGRQPGLVRSRMGVSQQSGAVALASNGSSLRATRPSNKGMKQTSVEHIGRSQLIPGVRRTDSVSREGRRELWQPPARLQSALTNQAEGCLARPAQAVGKVKVFLAPALQWPVENHPRRSGLAPLVEGRHASGTPRPSLLLAAIA
jgi:hypothetical protein